MEEVKKTAMCDSCGNETVVIATPHHQPNNPKLWWYCEVCKFAHDKEKKVQTALRAIASRDPLAAEDPAILAQLHEEAATQLLVEKAKNEKLAPNETLIAGEVTPEAQVAEQSTTQEEAPVQE